MRTCKDNFFVLRIYLAKKIYIYITDVNLKKNSKDFSAEEEKSKCNCLISRQAFKLGLTFISNMS